MTTTGAITTSDARNAADRIVERNPSGVTVARYGFGSAGKSASFTMNASGDGHRRTISLVGGGHPHQAIRRRRVELSQHPRRARRPCCEQVAVEFRIEDPHGPSRAVRQFGDRPDGMQVAGSGHLL